MDDGARPGRPVDEELEGPRLRAVPTPPLARLGEPFAANLVCVPLSFLQHVLAVVGDPAAHRQEAELVCRRLEAFLGTGGDLAPGVRG